MVTNYSLFQALQKFMNTMVCGTTTEELAIFIE